MESNKITIAKESENNHKKFTLREFGGSFGDWGTLVPFIIGYISIVGLNPAGIFLTLGITNIILGIKFNLPLPVQPQKTIGTVAISKGWDPNMVISTGFGTGVIWFLLGFSKKLNKIVSKVPIVAVRGIQLGLALILGWTGLKLFSENLFLGFISIAIILILIKNKPIPSAIILTFGGILIMFFTQTIFISELEFGFPLLTFQIPTWDNFLLGMVYAGLAQLFLTLTNVMVATVVLIKELFPDREGIDANTLAFNMGAMNLINPFLGGMPLCHGSGGLMAQYAFGARTGGSMILEGVMELILGLFFSEALLILFTEFPMAILGAMLIYTAFLLGKIALSDFNIKVFPIILTSAIICFSINIAIGFLIGLIIYLFFTKVIEKTDS
ncbi:MAG: putative sulfate/molybdate transporter [Candidatus Lokiarchaeota archaeon]|nr:putative sulfate/molybdate transporter [Candidatus Lokiarchaeota archaeon]